MESPTSWDLLTSTLAVVDLTQIAEAWAFMEVQGLVSCDAGDLEKFVSIVDAVRMEGPITGPSDALRIAQRLRAAIHVLPNAELPDPWAKIAESRLRSSTLALS